MSSASWFNVSRQETWESRHSFPSGDHKAVKRLERPRLWLRSRKAKPSQQSIFTNRYAEIGRPAPITPDRACLNKSFACGENAASACRWICGIRKVLDAADRLQPRARMNFSLRQHGGLRAEALDQRADERADRGRGDQHRRLAFAGGLPEGVADRGHELRQL